jgi:hypothetical protein
LWGQTDQRVKAPTGKSGWAIAENSAKANAFTDPRGAAQMHQMRLQDAQLLGFAR